VLVFIILVDNYLYYVRFLTEIALLLRTTFIMEKNNAATDALLKNLQEREREQSYFFSVSNSLAPITEIAPFTAVINQHFKEVLNFDDLVICTSDEHEQEYQVFYQHLNNSQKPSLAKYAVADSLFNACIESAENIVVELSSLISKKQDAADYIVKAHATGMRHIIAIALPHQKQLPAVLLLFYKKQHVLSRQAIRLLKSIGAQLSITLLNITRNKNWQHQEQELIALRKRPEQQILSTEEKVIAEDNFSGIIGSCDAMKRVFDLITQVAYSDSNVLIMGETGTGKELIAGAIHDNSSFNKKTMIRVNCAAIPANLIESELFGHEKGSFTGATDKRIGKFELAHNSTIFLDEIGELPLELQAKMLRVLQEREIERIGGNSSVKINVRIITATNRDLQTEVAEGRFRADLFYRLNVYPIVIPALRNRMEDLPLISNYFLSHHAKKTGKNITKFSHKAMQSMMAYHWPGNVRELGNIIERSVLYAKGDTIKEIHFPTIDVSPANEEDFKLQSLHDVEREHILKVIKKCNGRISGPYGAAVILDIPSTTLISKMQKLGIKKSHLIDTKP